MSAPHDRPTPAELVEAVKEWLASDAEPSRFHARVAANTLTIVERELAMGDDHALAHRIRLDQLGVADDAELAAAIRSRSLDDRADEVRDLVWASVRDKLAVANPGYLDRTEP